MQHELSKGPLLNENGDLVEAGFAKSLVKEYDRNKIRAGKLRIKEWDYYYIGNENYGFALTIADNSYMSLASVSFLDFTKPSQITKSVMGFMSKGKINLPSSSQDGDVFYKNKRVDFAFLNKKGQRHLICSYKNFIDGKDLRCDIYLKETNEGSMVIATPFKKKKHFYYNQKINCLASSGYVKIGEEIYDFNVGSFGVLDWGRGVWTYSNTWYWSSLNSINKGKRIGFNLGYGFGDTTQASENMFFYDDKAYKLGNVRFDIPISKNGSDDFMKPWKFRSDDGSIDMDFVPVINRHAAMNVGVIKSIQNQVFGRFSGTITVDEKRITFTDLLGFAEKVTNKW